MYMTWRDPNETIVKRNRPDHRNDSLLFTLCSLLFAFCFLLFVPHKSVATPQDSSVTYLDSITEDEQGNRLSFPNAVFAEADRNELYIISQNRIIIYTSDFFPVFTLDKRKGIENIHGLTVDARGNLYIAQGATKENPRKRISVFNACLNWERDIYLEGFEGAASFIPNHLAVDKKGNIYVAGSFFPGVLMLNNRGELLEIISAEKDAKKITFDNVAIDEAGRLYLLSVDLSNIFVYDENKKFLFTFGEKGGSSGKLSRPLAVSIDNRSGRIYVVDYMRHTVSAYDSNGKYLFEFGGLGWGEGWLQYPTNIAVDSQGRIFVADTFNDRIEVFKPNE